MKQLSFIVALFLCFSAIQGNAGCLEWLSCCLPFLKAETNLEQDNHDNHEEVGEKIPPYGRGLCTHEEKKEKVQPSPFKLVEKATNLSGNFDNIQSISNNEECYRWQIEELIKKNNALLEKGDFKSVRNFLERLSSLINQSIYKGKYSEIWEQVQHSLETRTLQHLSNPKENVSPYYPASALNTPPGSPYPFPSEFALSAEDENSDPNSMVYSESNGETSSPKVLLTL